MPHRKLKTLTRRTSIRIALPTFLTLLLFITAIFFILLPQLEQSFINRKKEAIKELTETAWSLLDSYHEREISGELSREEAQNRAIQRIRTLRYGPENKDYFWINDMTPRVIMHPYRSDLENSDVSDFHDPEGTYLFLEFVKTVETSGAGYVDYLWQWKDNPVKISRKLSYVKGFEPWDWIIGTGIYVDDVLAEISPIRNRLTAISSAILAIVSLLAVYSIRQTVLADRERLRIFRERENLMFSLKESCKRFQNLIEATSDWIWESDRDGTYLYSNPRVEEILGYAPEEIYGRSLVDIVALEERPGLEEEYRRILRSGSPFNGLECPCRHKGGTTVVLENSGVPVFDDDGELAGYRGIARDITERKTAMEELRKSRDQLNASLEETVRSLASTAEKRDPYTAGHQQRVDKLACAIARELDLPEERIEGLHIAALLHDIGKITLPSEYLAKPARLSREEEAIIKCHPSVGYDILKDIRFPWPVAEMVYQHHEHLDGSGYPRGLKGDEILPEARILAVADVVEAMSSHRPYRPSLGIAKALEEVSEGRGSRYQAEVVDACLKLVQEKKIEFPSNDWCPLFT